MNTDKKKSAVGVGAPATENRKEIPKVSITDSEKKIKTENMHEILARLTETLQLTRDGGNIVSITPLSDVARVTYSNGHTKDIDIGSDSGIAAVYDIAKALMY